MGTTRAQERRLVERARAGDPDAWEEVYRGVYPRLFTYARRRLATEEQADEAVSETMTRAMDKIDSYSPTGVGIDGWLFGIARNVVLEAYRASTRQTPADPAVLDEMQHGEAPDPVHAVLAAEEQSQLAFAFSRLSAADQEVLELRVVAGLDAEQVAVLTDRKAGAVRTAQSRALARLRTEFEGLMA
ncbi:sigma-70 family RNA polymerase sigma factor [Nocardioides sp. InS609-2]|uniref:RNA polymerase sigma factor n=1 Tax=Nocardioides sp. InS609-2 TaxID=2760705 RepID=UPI0020BE1B45|nr:sigma-70 family RNA polymerase sigma factor [Nocardioides sp. InS609-2]